MKNLYLAHYIDNRNEMNIGQDATCNVLLNFLKKYNPNVQNKYVNKINSLQSLKEYIEDAIKPNENGTFIFYFNGVGYHEKYEKINIETKKIESLIFEDNDTKEEVLNRDILKLIDKIEFSQINFYFILDTCNSGQFIAHAKEFNNVPITVFTATSENDTTNTSVLSEFFNVVSYGLFKNMFTFASFEALFNAWFSIKKTNDSPQFYSNNHQNKSKIFLI